MSRRTSAVAYAQHYFAMLAKSCGIPWRPDNDAEIAAFVNTTIDAAVEEALAKFSEQASQGGYGHGGFREREKPTRDVPTVPAEDVPLCPYCEQSATLRASEDIYGKGHDYGWMWRCENDDCDYCDDAYVGCHRGTTTPFGTLANRETRAARQAAHAAFDPLWKHGGYTRGEAYAWLAEKFGEDEIHIGKSDEARCRQIIKYCEKEMNE